MEEETQKALIVPTGIALSNLEQLGNCIMRLAQETRRSYSSGNFLLANEWLKAVNDKASVLDLSELEIDFDFIKHVREKK
jgi:hypothetical protein